MKWKMLVSHEWKLLLAVLLPRAECITLPAALEWDSCEPSLFKQAGGCCVMLL